MSKKAKAAEKLAEYLEEYIYDIEEAEDGAEREGYGDLYIVDALCDMNEILYKDGANEGRYYEGFMLMTDQPIKLFDVVEVTRTLSGTKDKMKVMSIVNVRPSNDGKMIVEMLGAKVREA